MAKRSLKPCRHPGCPELTRDGWCPKHRPAPDRAGEGPAGPITAGIPRPSGPRNCAQHNCCGNLSAGSVRPRGGAPLPRWWTMLSPSVETGTCLSVRPITRACASSTTTRRPPGNKQKAGEKRASFEGAPPWKATPARPGVGECVCIHLRAQARRQSRGPPPGSEKFWGILPRPRCSLVCEKKSPMENLERRFCLCQLT